MTKMVPIARSKADKKAEAKRFSSNSTIDTPDYPYGSRVDLDHETLEKAHPGPLPKSGTKFSMQVQGHVHSTEETSRDGKKRRNMTLQITHMPENLGKGGGGERSVRDDLEDAAKDVK